MAKYNTIAVIYGSDSSESDISCRGGEFVASRIDDTVYDVYQIFARFGKWSLVAFRKKNSVRVTFPPEAMPEIDKNDFSVTVYGEKIKFDFAYIMQHGIPGENGLLQGYFEMLSIPFSTSSAFVSALSFDKYSCKSYLKSVDFVKLSPDVFVRKGNNLDEICASVNAKLSYPVFVKPTDGGSSFGITKVKTPEQLKEAINYAFTEGDTLIVEQGVTGRELTCAVFFDGTRPYALPVIEIITDHDYFDYDAKYNGASQEVCPAEISHELSELVKRTSEKIYTHMGCSGVVRIDYISSDEGLYFLEINSVPGMTSASLVPKAVRAEGIQMTDFLSTIIENS